MTAYATAANFSDYGIGPAALPATITDVDRLAAISAASGVADSYLGARFRLPLAVWGDDLSQAVCKIAAFELVAAKVGFNPEAGHNMVLLDRKNDAIRWLEQVARGHVTPAGITDTSPTSPGASHVTSSTPRGW